MDPMPCTNNFYSFIYKFRKKKKVASVDLPRLEAGTLTVKGETFNNDKIMGRDKKETILQPL